MPAKSTALQSIKSLLYDQSVPFQVSELWTCHNVYLLLSKRFKIGIPNICGKSLQVIEFGNEGQDPDAA